jgi:hypothetical protein
MCERERRTIYWGGFLSAEMTTRQRERIVVSEIDERGREGGMDS